MRLGPDSGGPFTVQVLSWRDIPFRTVVRQQYDFSCGAAAVATLLRYQYDRNTTENDVFKAMWEVGDQAQIRRQGFSMLDMKRYLESIGYAADGYRMSLEDLAKLETPAITLIQIGNYKHFVTIKGVHSDKVLIGDPALGLLTVNRDKFLSIWNGIVFAIHARPAGTPDPAFNVKGEWSPWAVAPTQAALPSWALADLTMTLPPLYQITPEILVNLNNPLGSLQ